MTGTPVGYDCGDGMIEGRRALDILARHRYQGILCVDCGTVDQAGRSLRCLRGLLA